MLDAESHWHVLHVAHSAEVTHTLQFEFEHLNSHTFTIGAHLHRLIESHSAEVHDQQLESEHFCTHVLIAESHWHDGKTVHPDWLAHAQQFKSEHFCSHVLVVESHWHEADMAHSVLFGQAPQFVPLHKGGDGGFVLHMPVV